MMVAAHAQDSSIPVSADGYYLVETLQQFQDAEKNDLSEDGTKSYSRIRLTADLFLSDLSERTFNNTFCGNLDGDGHTIWAARPEVQHDGGGHYKRTYLFTYSKGATYRNLTFKDIRVQSEDNYYQAIITSQAWGQSVFENITLDHVSVFGDENYVGSVAGAVTNCVLKNIVVKNSDFTTDDYFVSPVVAYAEKCTFSNIEVNNCTSFAYNSHAAGVVGEDYNSTYTDISIKGCRICSKGELDLNRRISSSGGISAYTEGSTFERCFVDEQTTIFADMQGASRAGGIVGYLTGGTIKSCVNSALVCGDGMDCGGIVGFVEVWSTIECCVNTGMIASIDYSDVDELIAAYTNNSMPCHPISYKGAYYMVRTLPLNGLRDLISNDKYFGGIAGRACRSYITECANYGMICSTGNYLGGIIGFSGSDNKINDCISDYQKYNDKCYAFAGGGDSDAGIKVTNCLSLSNTSDAKGQELITHTNCYVKGKASWAQEVTDQDLMTGSVAAKLGKNWAQHIGEEMSPKPTAKGTGPDIYLTRELGEGLGSICVPFAIASDEEVQLYKPVETVYSDDHTSCFFRLQAVESLDAGVPGFYLTLKPGVVHAFRATASSAIEPEYKGYLFGRYECPWTVKGTMFSEILNGGDTYYSLSGRELKNNPTYIPPFSTYVVGRSPEDNENIRNFLSVGTSIYDLNFDGEVSVGDEVLYVKLAGEDPDFTPFCQGDAKQNARKLSAVILQE